MHELPCRKPIRMERDVYAREGLVCHLTICCEHGRSCLEHPEYADAVFRSVMEGPVSLESDLYAVCVMPDHVHLLLSITTTNLIDLMNRWKSFTTNLLHAMGMEGKLWQRSFYDHILKAEEQVAQTAEYIAANPVRAGLVEDPLHYPYSWHRWMEPQDGP